MARVSVGDIVFLKGEGNKHTVKDMYIVTDKNVDQTNYMISIVNNACVCKLQKVRPTWQKAPRQDIIHSALVSE